MDAKSPVVEKFSTDQIGRLRIELDTELNGNILNYWSTRMVDETFGGFYGRRDGFDNLEKNAAKGVILNTRILWTYSHASRLVSKKYQPLADRAYKYFRQCFLDLDKGGVFWMVDHKGYPLETKKQIYAQAFAIYALSEYHLATDSDQSLHFAIGLYELVEKYSFDNVDNGYLEAFDRNWNLLTDLRLSEKDANEKKTMNTHLHILEAYTNLYRCWRDATLKKQLRNLIELFRDKIIDEHLHFNLFFDERWDLKSKEISFGHDIEGSWLLYEAAVVLGDQDLIDDLKILSVKMVDVVIENGLDVDGGLMNDTHDSDKHWWPQAEAMVGLVHAWQVTNDPKYLSTAIRVWNFIKDKLIDRQHGEWHWSVNRIGHINLNEDKAGPWKCPYHNGRAMFELLKRLPQ